MLYSPPPTLFATYGTYHLSNYQLTKKTLHDAIIVVIVQDASSAKCNVLFMLLLKGYNRKNVSFMFSNSGTIYNRVELQFISIAKISCQALFYIDKIPLL
jgi:hypothetical protein